MPQLDKLSFATQYFWLTLFFFGLYFLTTNFFVIIVFKNLKLKNIIYKIWYFFLFHFDYLEYYNKNQQLNNTTFNSIYINLYSKFIIILKSIVLLNSFNWVLNKNFVLSFYTEAVNFNLFDFFIFNLFINVTKQLQKLNNLIIDEI